MESNGWFSLTECPRNRHFQPLVQLVVSITIKLLATMYNVAKISCTHKIRPRAIHALELDTCHGKPGCTWCRLSPSALLQPLRLIVYSPIELLVCGRLGGSTSTREAVAIPIVVDVYLTSKHTA